MSAALVADLGRVLAGGVGPLSPVVLDNPGHFEPVEGADLNGQRGLTVTGCHHCVLGKAERQNTSAAFSF